MASVSKRPDRDGRPGGWLVRWREINGTQRKKSFTKRAEAVAFAQEVDSRTLIGEYVSPGAGKATVGEWSAVWLGTQNHLKPSTLQRYRSLVATHVTPKWGTVKLQDVRHGDVAQWVADLSASGLSASSVRHAYRVLSLMLDYAVKDGRLPRNVAVKVKLPRPRRDEPRFLTHRELQRLAEACPDDGLIVLFLAMTGLRFGELSALRAGDIDLDKRRIRVHRAATEVNGKWIEGTPKTHQSRIVGLPQFVVDILRPKLSDDPTAFAFPAPAGGPLRLRNWRRNVFNPACEAAELTALTPHDLRHTAASLAVQAGANVKVVQRMLGHASAAMTLDIYAGLFADDLDQVAERLDALAPRVRPMHLNAELTTVDGVLRNRHLPAVSP